MTVAEMLMKTASALRERGIPSPILDAEVLVAHALSVDRIRLIIDGDREVGRAEQGRVDRLLSRRLTFEPVAYITGKKEFYSLSFTVTSAVLIPRPETELLVDLTIYYAPYQSDILDVGTGSGAIAVAVKHNRADCRLFASDISNDALNVARKNAVAFLGTRAVTFRQGDLFTPWRGARFSVIAVNPPYIDPALAGSLQPDLAFEPAGALYAGDAGRAVVARVLNEAASCLAPGGVLLMEIGADMKDYVTERAAGYSLSVMSDYAGRDRVAVLKLAGG